MNVAALPFLALRRELAAVQLDQFLHQRQADSRALVASPSRAFDTMEAFEDARQLVRRDAGAGVLDREHRAIAVDSRADEDAARRA